MFYKSGYKYVVSRMLDVALPQWAAVLHTNVDTFVVIEDGRLFIARGYAWDGASFILFKLFGTPDAWKLASLVHDAFYQLMRENQLAMSYRDEVDAIFYTLLRERGVSCLVAKVAYYAVRLGGNYAIRRGGPKEQEVV